MPNVTLSQSLAAIVNALGIENRLQACAAFKNALGDDRRVLVIRNGLTVRNCTLSGIMRSTAGNVTDLGLTSADIAALGADLTTGTTILRVTGGGHSFEGSLGIFDPEDPEKYTFFTTQNLTPANGLALVNINIPVRADLPLSNEVEGVPLRIEIEDRTGLADSDPTPGPKTSIYFDENAGDIVPDHPIKKAEVGRFGLWQCSETLKLGTGGDRFEIGLLRATLPPVCNDEVNSENYEVFGWYKAFERPSGWGGVVMENYDPLTDSTFPPPHKFRVFDSFDNEVPMYIPLGMMGDIAINSDAMAQQRNLTDRWRPFTFTGQQIYGSTHRLKRSVNADKLAPPMLPGYSDRPGQARAPASANRAYPPLLTGYQQVNSFGHWFYAPALSMTTAYGGYPQTDPYAPNWEGIDPTGNADDGGRMGYRAQGYLWEQGAWAQHDLYGPAGGNGSDRFHQHTARVMVMMHPDGVRPQGSVPYKLLDYHYNLGYFSHGWHLVLDVRTGEGLPHDLAGYGGYAFCNNKYTQQGPIFVPGHAEDRHIDLFGRDYGEPPRDKDGLLPRQGWEMDMPHSYNNAAWMAWDYNSPAAIFSAMMCYHASLMSGGSSGSPFHTYRGFIMQRSHAWRWNTHCLAWAVACTHESPTPRLLTQLQIETRAIIEFEYAYDDVVVPAITPGHAEYNTIFNIGLRNFGIPGVEYVNNADGTHCIASVDDAKLFYLGGVISTMDIVGFTARIEEKSVKGGQFIGFGKDRLYTYGPEQFAATHGRALFWQPDRPGSGQMGPFVPVGQPLVAYSGFDEWASIHAPVDGQADLVRNADGTPVYAERHQYQHLMVQTIFQFRDSIGGEAERPGITALCVIAKEQQDYKANLIATNYYGNIYGDYELMWPPGGIQAPPVV